ncbi:MAG: hypothetical protein JJE35_08280 [Thermoleophilia bacterium]|nr:hypothetical protein [Thermoleophilia bacterium]
MDAVVILSGFLPRVEDPWPDEIGLGFPFAIAGVFGAIAEFRFGAAPDHDRDRAVHRWGLIGLHLGAAVYTVSVLAQVAS